jgi:hypothetical protein
MKKSKKLVNHKFLPDDKPYLKFENVILNNNVAWLDILNDVNFREKTQ